MVQRSLMQRKRVLQRDDHLGAAGMADEAVDFVDRNLHPREHFGDRGAHVVPDEIGNRPLKDHAKPFGVDAPPHDVERIGPQFLAGGLDPGCAAVACAQYDRRGAIAEQAGGDDIGLGQLIVADGQRAELERHQQHIGAGPRLRQPRRDRQPRHAARASQTEDRHARHIGAQAEFAGDPRLQRRRCDPGRAHRHDGIDIGGGEIGLCERLARDVKEQDFGAFQECLRSAPAIRAARDTIPSA